MKVFENRDCMEGMRDYEDGFFDLAVVDPNYGINCGDQRRQKSRTKLALAKDYNYSGWDKDPVSKEVLNKILRVSKNSIIWGANHFISRTPFDSSCWIVWDKDNTGDFADCELAWTSFNSSVRKFKYRWNGMLQENMGKFKEQRIHPTQKPIALYIWLLTNYAKPGFKILDTHVGSASSLCACEKLGFDYVGFELDPDYYKAAKERIKNFTAQTSFLGEL